MTSPVRTSILPFALAVACTWLYPASASADEKAECVVAHEAGQVARREGRFDRAREAFAACQRDACPGVIRSRCAELARDLEVIQPTLIVVVQDAQGGDPGDARVGIDGAAPAAVSGMALRLNPGKHVLRVESAGFLPSEKTVMLPESIKDMQAVISLQRPQLGTPVVIAKPLVRAKPATAAWAFAIGSGVSLAGAAALAGVGWAVHGDLKSSCGSTGCSESQVEPLRALWPASFVALGVGVVTAAIATLLFTTASGGSASTALFAPDAAGIRF
jgi:hypothetical protein